MEASSSQSLPDNYCEEQCPMYKQRDRIQGNTISDVRALAMMEMRFPGILEGNPDIMKNMGMSEVVVNCALKASRDECQVFEQPRYIY